MATTDRVIADDAIRVLDHGFVRLDDAMADDLAVVNAARVSFARRVTAMTEADEGLIRFLMRERHGCYDEATDVLTLDGWKAWPDVRGDEWFATRSEQGVLEYQPALRLVRKEHRGHMVGFKGMSVDMLVTPDHRVLASGITTRDLRAEPRFSLVPAHAVLWRAHRHTATATWPAPDPSWLTFDDLQFPAEPLLSLVGLFIGDGYLAGGSQIVFRLRKPREITFLRRIATAAALEVRESSHERYAVPLLPEMRALFASCYDANREKVVPRPLLGLGVNSLRALLDGLMNSDGTVTVRPNGADKWTYCTTSRALADQVQEIALKIGRSASLRPHQARPGNGHFGSKDRYRITVYNERNTRPALCRTRADADNHMGVEQYNGVIHCVEVSNHTLYVRRNGFAVWSGNTPFEHNSFRFHIRSPIFVAREWMRHRTNSFNEFSMRYAKATEDFYVPEPEDVRSQVGKPGAYTFERVGDDLAEETRDAMREVYEQAYSTYEQLVEKGVAREVARSVLPVGAYTEFYWTVNARSLMNFVSLRNAETAQREIRRYAEAVETFLAARMPLTYAAFVANDRTAP